MGKLLNGPYGAVSGKVGKLVSYELRGQNIIRKNRTGNIKATAKQLACRQSINVLTAFLKPIKHFVNLGFMFEAEGTIRHAYNEASSYILKNAITGEYPDIRIKYEKVKLSIGTLSSATSPSVNKLEEAIVINWGYDAKVDFHLRYDRAMILLYFAETKSAIYFLSGSMRSELKQVIDLGSVTIKEPCHIYLSFFSEDRKSVSDSTYLYHL